MVFCNDCLIGSKYEMAPNILQNGLGKIRKINSLLGYFNVAAACFSAPLFAFLGSFHSFVA